MIKRESLIGKEVVWFNKDKHKWVTNAVIDELVDNRGFEEIVYVVMVGEDGDKILIEEERVNVKGNVDKENEKNLSETKSDVLDKNQTLKSLSRYIWRINEVGRTGDELAWNEDQRRWMWRFLDTTPEVLKLSSTPSNSFFATTDTYKQAIQPPSIYDFPNSEQAKVLKQYKDRFDMKSTPILGLKPKSIHNHNRIGEISEAIKRYVEAGMYIPQEWLDEYSELREYLTKKDSPIV